MQRSDSLLLVMPKSVLSSCSLLSLLMGELCCSGGSRLYAQGETTSAIVGQVSDPTSAAIAGATVTVKNTDTGLTRSVKTDDAGRFNFPQLKPGSYAVKAEAGGFEPQQQDSVFSGLGQKQSVNFTLPLASAR